MSATIASLVLQTLAVVAASPSNGLSPAQRTKIDEIVAAARRATPKDQIWSPTPQEVLKGCEELLQRTAVWGTSENRYDALRTIECAQNRVKGAVERLAPLVKSSDPIVRKAAIFAVVELGGAQAEAILAKVPPKSLTESEKQEVGRTRRARELRLCVRPELPIEDLARVRALADVAFVPLSNPSVDAEEALFALGPLALYELRTRLASSATFGLLKILGPVQPDAGAMAPVAPRTRPGELPASDRYVSRRAAKMIVRMGRAAIGCAVDGLRDPAAAPMASKALELMTGEYFGASFDAWADWYVRARPTVRE